MFSDFIDGFEMGLKAFASFGGDYERVATGHAEVCGGLLLEGYDAGLAFASFLYANACKALG